MILNDATGKNTESMKNNKVDISFIIPVFNGGEKTARLIESIDRMPEEISFEVIAVNDGSTDETAEVLKTLQDGHNRFLVITTENRGQSHARNEGLKKAAGDYIFFADADDSVCAEGVANLFRAAKKEKSDITCGTYVRIEDGKEPYRALAGFESGLVSREEGELFSKLKTESAFGYLWNKLFLRSSLLEQDLFFDEEIPVYMEDQLFNLKAFACGARYYFLNEVVYEYNFVGESETRRPDPLIAEKSVQMLKSYGAFLEKKKAKEENRDLFVPLAMRMICWAAFKNIRYEGAVYFKIKERLTTFTKEPHLAEMFQDPESRKQIKALPSFLQRCFFGLSFSMLRKKKEGLLSAVFVIASPLLKQAAKSMVR